MLEVNIQQKTESNVHQFVLSIAIHLLGLIIAED